MPCPTLSRIRTLLLALLLTPGCRTAQHSTGEQQLPVFASAIPRQVERSRDILGFEEITAKGAHSAYEAIVLLRPEFLRRRSAEFNDPDAVSSKRRSNELAESIENWFPAIFLNGLRQGGPAALRTIPANAILEIRYYREMQVPAVYGFNNPGGVIDVRTTP